jgi:hypothetical protein
MENKTRLSPSSISAAPVSKKSFQQAATKSPTLPGVIYAVRGRVSNF